MNPLLPRRGDEACGPSGYVPPGLLLQWHVTDRCNLRCVHCYQDSYQGAELALPDLLRILEQYETLLTQWRIQRQTGRVRGHITVTGGEPFVRPDFFDLLEVLHARRRRFSFAILTNGSLIDREVAQRLRALKPAFVQVSMEGTQKTHDSIRGAGNFDRTVAAVKHLVRARIRTLISFTATRLNFREFPEVVRVGQRLRVSRVWADRVIPCGHGEQLREQILSPDETLEFFRVMHEAQAAAKRRWFARTEVAMHRALQFLVAGGSPYHCTAADSLITVQPNGDLYPCRRLPIRVGNLLETPLAELYYQDELLRQLRDRKNLSTDCQGCLHSRACRGGLKCLSYAVTGNPFATDPGCWLPAKRGGFFAAK